MHTTISYTFRAQPMSEHLGTNWIMSAGRWDTHIEAVKAASNWLLHMAGETPQQYAIGIIQVEELELV